MKDKERDVLDDLFRQKLQQIEADTTPEDWEAIMMRLPKRIEIPYKRQRWYWAAACVVVLLMGGGGLYYLSQQYQSGLEDIDNRLAGVQTPVLSPDTSMQETPSVVTPAQSTGLSRRIPYPGEKTIAKESIPPRSTLPEKILPEEIIVPKPVSAGNNKIWTVKDQTFLADAAPLPSTHRPTSTIRKWGFGTGMGFMQSSGEVVNTYLRSSHYMEDEELLSINAVSDQNLGKIPKTNIKHKKPLSFGFSVSRYLSPRFSLQSGLVYSLLISDWETQATAYNNKTRQTLHWVGIPLSISYKIAEWKRLQVYASAGGQADMNVAGQLRVKNYSNNLQTGVTYANQRMKEWQWSVNARAGVSYPLIPYISVFGEVGAAYYFDNGSDMETIYSDKAFNISPQIGLRLSF
ncbi:MAG: PorT family protein [Tannerellaceae bacterium]|jgi:hypothetical protein|nr:PorT family protein [Tannerellaceae bacterium]